MSRTSKPKNYKRKKEKYILLFPIPKESSRVFEGTLGRLEKSPVYLVILNSIEATV
jgi:hypothetical protein